MIVQIDSNSKAVQLKNSKLIESNFEIFWKKAKRKFNLDKIDQVSE